LTKQLIKYLFFSDYFLVIKNYVSQYLTITCRWFVLLFSKDKEIELVSLKIKTQNLVGLTKNQLSFEFKKVLFFELKFRNQQKIFISNNSLNSFSIRPNNSLDFNNNKWTFYGNKIKSCDSFFNIYSSLNINDTLIVTAYGFGKRVFREEYLLSDKYIITENPISLNNHNLSLVINKISFTLQELISTSTKISKLSTKKLFFVTNFKFENTKHDKKLLIKNIPFIKVNNSIYNIYQFNKNNYL